MFSVFLILTSASLYIHFHPIITPGVQFLVLPIQPQISHRLVIHIPQRATDNTKD